jgi:5'-deoxynucleotidase YfbR-like HD superfamily hydrolase
MNSLELVQEYRTATKVERCHTIPHHGSYSIGQHSADALALLFAIKPTVSANLCKAMLMHDFAEQYLGDLPATAKWENPKLKQVYEEAEEQALKSLCGDFDLTEEEAIWLRWADILEFFFWCLDQQRLGNMNVQQPLKNAAGWIQKNLNTAPEQIIQLIGEITDENKQA